MLDMNRIGINKDKTTMRISERQWTKKEKDKSK